MRAREVRRKTTDLALSLCAGVSAAAMLISAWYNNRLPFDAVRNVSEYPFAVTTLMGFGAQPRVR